MGFFGKSRFGSGRVSEAEQPELAAARKKIKYLATREQELKKWEILSEVAPEIPLVEARQLIHNSKSQIGQDVFVAGALGFAGGLRREPGFFVEFGATNGVGHSNSWLFENFFGWEGILAEPNAVFFPQLEKNRPGAFLSNSAVAHESGLQLSFIDAGALSTFTKYAGQDHHSRPVRAEQMVETISLNDLLTQGSAPSRISFLSVDTEGSELEILEAVDWDRWSFDAIVVEHNYSVTEEPLSGLLSDKGYVQVLRKLSGQDSWWLNPGAVKKAWLETLTR